MGGKGNEKGCVFITNYADPSQTPKLFLAKKAGGRLSTGECGQTLE